MLVSLVNAQSVNKKRVAVPYSQFKASLLKLLQAKGMIAKVRLQESAKPKLIVSLAYENGQPKLHGLSRLSTPGQRIYASHKHIPYIYDGTGFVIISTSQGLVDDREARAKKLGGELVCKVW